MEIRLATLNDIEPICRLYNEFFAYNAQLQPKYCNAGKEYGEYPASVIENSDSDIFLAVNAGSIVGLIHVREAKTPPFDSIVQHKYAEIIDLIVTASFREKGVGSLLLDTAKKWSKARNLDYIELIVLSNAKAAIHFYDREGFDIVSHTMRSEI